MSDVSDIIVMLKYDKDSVYRISHVEQGYAFVTGCLASGYRINSVRVFKLDDIVPIGVVDEIYFSSYIDYRDIDFNELLKQSS